MQLNVHKLMEQTTDCNPKLDTCFGLKQCINNAYIEIMIILDNVLLLPAVN